NILCLSTVLLYTCKPTTAQLHIGLIVGMQLIISIASPYYDWLIKWHYIPLLYLLICLILAVRRVFIPLLYEWKLLAFQYVFVVSFISSLYYVCYQFWQPLPIIFLYMFIIVHICLLLVISYFILYFFIQNKTSNV